MRSLIYILAVSILASACSSNSGSSSNSANLTSSSSSSTSTSSGGWVKPSIELICDDKTPYEISIQSSGDSSLGATLVLTDTRFFNEALEGNYFIISNSGERLDHTRVQLGELPQAPGSVAGSVLISIRETGIELSHINSSEVEEVFSYACSNPLDPASTCEGLSIDLESKTITFSDLALNSDTSSVTLNGSLLWAFDAEINSERPSCLPTAKRESMVGSWMSTLDYGDGIIDDLLYIITDTHLHYYDYQGDTYTGTVGPDCYTFLEKNEIAGTLPELPGSIIFRVEGSATSESFIYHFREYYEKRVLTFENYYPETLIPVTETLNTLKICDF